MAKLKSKPDIRFAGFTDAWEQRKLVNVAQSFEYGLNVAATEFDGENKYLRITDIDDSTHEFKSDDLTSPDMDLTKAENYRLRDGDILFARTGASVGKTYKYKASDGLVYFAGFLIRARIKPEYDSGFVFHNTLTGRYSSFISITSQRSGQPGVNAQEYGEFLFSTPKLPEQQKISAFFDNLDRLITLHQRKYDKTVNIKKSMLEKMFPKNGADRPEIRFAGFTDAWEQRKFDDLVFRVSIASDNDDSPRVEYDDIVSGQGQLNKDIYEKKSDKKGIKFEPHDTLFGKLRPYLHNWLLPDFNGVAVGDFWVFRPNEMNHEFIYTLIQSAKYQYVANLSTGTKMPRSDWNVVSKTTFAIPSDITEQAKIGAAFSHLDRLITLHQRELIKFQNMKKALLEKMFV